ncbi:MAG: Flp pilus assembly protein CpaB [Pseudomonadota bacterium]
MRSRALLLLGLALVFGGLAAFMVNQLTTSQDAPPTQTGTSRPDVAVVVASADIPQGATLTDDMLRLARLPEDSFPDSAFRSIGSVLENQPVLAMAQLSEGEVILPNRLSTGNRSRGITGRIPEGYRAIAIPINAVRSVSGFVFPGTRVDVLHTTNVGRQDDEPVTRTLLQDVTVLSINQQASEFVEEPMVGNLANLLVSPDDAKALILAQEVGQLTLALRSDSDNEVMDPSEVRTVTLRDLWTLTPEERAAAQEAARRRAEERARQEALRPVGIIRGTNVSEQIVPPENDSTAAAARSN